MALYLFKGDGQLYHAKKTKETCDLDVDLSGTIDNNFNCLAQNYAQGVSASLLQQNRNVRITSYKYRVTPIKP